MGKRQHAVKSDVSGRRPRSPAADAFSALVVQVFRLAGLLATVCDAMARPAGQTSARWQVLAAVEEAPAAVAAIARALNLARQSVQRVADLLVAEGLASYEDNPEHRRAKLLRLTPRGRSALAAIQDVQRAWADKIGRAVGEADLRRAGTVLERVLGLLDRPVV